MFELILQGPTRVEIIQEIDILLGILIIGFLFFGHITKALIFNLAAAILILFIGFAYIEVSFMIFLSMIGIFFTLLAYTFWGGISKPWKNLW